MESYCSVVTLHQPAFRIPISDLHTFVDQVEQRTGILSVNQEYVSDGYFVLLKSLSPLRRANEIHIIPNEIESSGFYIEVASKEYRVNILNPSRKTVSHLLYSIDSKFSELQLSFPISEYALYFNSQKLSLDFPLSEIPSEEVLNFVQEATYPPLNAMIIKIRTLTGKKIQIGVNPGMEILTVKKLLCEIENVPVDEQQLLFGGTELVNDRFLEEYSICNASELQLLFKFRGGGGCPSVKFNEVKSSVTLKFSDKAPRWRHVRKGISFRGTCGNSECEAFKEEVLSNSGYGIFDIKQKMRIICCPICNSLLRNAQNCGFYMAKWTILKVDSEGNKSEVTGEVWEHNYTTFKEGETANYTSLKIEVTAKE